MKIKNKINIPTEFQYKKLKVKLTKNIVDFTEAKILSLIKKTESLTSMLVLINLLNKYRNGEIAISWKGITPTSVNIIQ